MHQFDVAHASKLGAFAPLPNGPVTDHELPL
jgi:hypothetical protein